KDAAKLLDEGYSKEEILNKTGCTVAVNKANFVVKEGEFYVIMVLSGSGKSTVIRLLNPLIEPTDGSILIEGNDNSNLHNNDVLKFRCEKFSIVLPSFALFHKRIIFANV